jgi:hypothetical protein
MSETDRGADAFREYFTAIETEFIRRRGSPFLLSPKDFALIQRWRELGIPLGDVLLGIAEAFDRRVERGALTKINSVSYCEGAVLEAWERNASARVGKEGAEPGRLDTDAILERLAEAMESAGNGRKELSEPALKASRSIRRLKASGRSAEQIEDSLMRLEKRFLRDAAAALAAEEYAAIEAEVDRRMDPDRNTMETRALHRTREILIRRKLRAQLGVPRLSLLR